MRKWRGCGGCGTRMMLCISSGFKSNTEAGRRKEEARRRRKPGGERSSISTPFDLMNIQVQAELTCEEGMRQTDLSVLEL
jgi:hypothetical protein